MSEQDLLALWERGEESSAPERALSLLAYGYPARTRSELVALSIGQRNELLLRLRERVFGELLQSSANCGACSTKIDFALTVDTLCSAAKKQPVQKDLTLRWQDFLVGFRLPTSADLLAIDSLVREQPEQALARLSRGCVLWIASADESQSQSELALPEELPAELIDALAASITEHDPLAEILLDMTCPDCGQPWQTQLDISAYFLSELEVQARRLLFELGTLARAFGWTEETILSLSARRRRAYLQMVGA